MRKALQKNFEELSTIWRKMINSSMKRYNIK